MSKRKANKAYELVRGTERIVVAARSTKGAISWAKQNGHGDFHSADIRELDPQMVAEAINRKKP